jgi:ubiquinone biosynthesis UbiH/UbiF/VisC/COQ6 family hydroxylase
VAKHNEFDVVVIGGGLVGAAFAAALAPLPIEIALVEAHAPQIPVPAAVDWDPRVYAISPASARFLAGLGAWETMPAERIEPVRRMRVFGDDGRAGITFDAMETGVPELAWIVESRVVHAALWRRLEAQQNLKLFCPGHCTALSLEGGGARVQLKGGKRLSAQLVVGADGARSWVREHAEFWSEDRPYHQLGVVANFATEIEHGGVAWQWFRPEGTLAYLPLPGKRISIVWAAADHAAQQLLALPAIEFARRVAGAGHQALGELIQITPPQSFPLHLLTMSRSVAPGVALIGDAAHVLHPLAGQGVNLGFADAQALAAALSGREPFRTCGDSRLLRQYERGRGEERFTLQFATDGLQRLFSSENRALRVVRNRGMELTGSLAVVRNLLARRALGTS